MTSLRIAVLGCGHLGRIHTRLVRNQPACELVGVYDVVPAAREAIAREFQVAAWDDVTKLTEYIDAAIIATPTRHHHEVAADLLRRGVHCFVEKPITSTLAEADELVQLAARRDRVLQVGHVERFNPAWRAAAAHVERPRLFHAARTSGYTFRSTDVGVVLDLMIHDLDLVLSTMTAELTQVSAWGQAVVGPYEDVAYARLQFADGAVAQLTASRVSPQAQRTVQVYCDHAHVSLDLAAGTGKLARVSDRLARRELDPNLLSAAEKTPLRDHFFQELMPVEDLVVTPGNAIEDEQRDFLYAIRTGRAPQVTGVSGRKTLAVAQAILDQITVAASERPTTLPYPLPVFETSAVEESREYRRAG